MHILLIEDNPDDVVLIREMLSAVPGVSFEVDVAGSLEEGLERLSLNGHDAVVVDLGLPDSRGLSTLESLERAGHGLPILVLTGHDDEETALCALRRGAQDYLVKGDIDSERVARALRYARERARLLREIEEAEERLRQSSRLAALGRLAGGIAHDFNNQLSVILGYTEMALLRCADPTMGDQLRQVELAARRSATLIRHLLAFSRQQVLEPRVIDAASWLRSAQAMLLPVVGENVALNIARPEESPGSIRVDPAQLDHVLVNLIANARDAIGSRSGRILVELERVTLEREEDADPEPVPAGSYVRISVEDSGAGMSAEVLEHVFDPFYSTKKASGGTGLGLSTVHGIVRQSGGHVRARSELGAGSRFELLFPRVEDPADDHEEPARPAAQRVAGAVLVVEDEAVIRRLLHTVLQNAGLEVHLAAEGAEAMAVLKDLDRRIDLLLTDVVMPGMDGREIARLGRQLRPDLKVVYMSGYSEGMFLENGRLEDGAVFLQKPISPQTLLARLRELLG